MPLISQLLALVVLFLFLASLVYIFQVRHTGAQWQQDMQGFEDMNLINTNGINYTAK